MCKVECEQYKVMAGKACAELRVLFCRECFLLVVQDELMSSSIGRLGLSFHGVMSCLYCIIV